METHGREPGLEADLANARERLAQLEAQLAQVRTSERRLLQAHEASNIPMILLSAIRDDDGRVIDFRYEYANEVSLRVLGRSLEEILGDRLLRVVPGHRHHGALFERFRHVVDSGTPDEVEFQYAGEGISGWFHSLAAKVDDGVAVFFRDITAAKSQQDALRRSERENRLLAERYGGLVRALAEVVWTADTSGMGLDAPSFRRLTGQTELEAAGLGWMNAVHPEDREEVARRLAARIGEVKPFAMEYRLRTASGDYRYVQGRAVPLIDQDGTVREWVGVCIDDDERKRAEEALRRREREFVTLAESAPDIIARFDRALRIMYVNPAIRSLAGLDPDECAGKMPDELGAPRSVARAWRRELTMAIEGKAPRTFEFEVDRASGSGTLFLQARVVPEIDVHGAVQGVIAVLRDLTDLKRNEEALRESESFLALAQKSARMGVWALDLASGESRWSSECYAIYGRDPTSPSPTYEEWLSYIHPDDRSAIEQTTGRVRQGDLDAWRLQFRIGHPERGERWLLEVGERTAGRGAGITLDVTDQKQAEEQLRQSSKMEAIGRLAGGLAHDFNNQLQVINGFANVVARDEGLGPRSRRQLEEIGKAADRMGSLTSQLLAFSRKQVLRPETVDLDTAISEDEGMLARLVGAHVRIRLELGRGSKWVSVDRGQLLQVLLNLTINARDAMPEGGAVTIRTSTRDVGPGELDEIADVHVAPGRYAELAVSDTGEGVDPQLLSHVFEPFFTTKMVGRGTGLGLATVHGIVAQSRGCVWMKSASGRGTTVTVLLPTIDEAPVAAPEPGGPRESVHGRRVLVVEDEPAVRRFLVDALEAEGLEVFESENGRDALARLEALNGAVDLIVSDAVMPVMSGPALAHELRHRELDVPILWMSGYTREMAFDGGSTGAERPFLQKPVSTSRLLEAVRASLCGKRQVVRAARPRTNR